MFYTIFILTFCATALAKQLPIFNYDQGMLYLFI